MLPTFEPLNIKCPHCDKPLHPDAMEGEQCQHCGVEVYIRQILEKEGKL